MTLSGLDPIRCKSLAASVSASSRSFDSVAASVRSIAAAAALNAMAAAPRELLAELSQELTLLARVLNSKADAMLAIGNTQVSSDFSRRGSESLTSLEASLSDGTGEGALAGDNALEAVAENFSKIDSDGDGRVTLEELKAASSSGDNESLRRAAKYLAENPALFSSIAPFVQQTVGHAGGAMSRTVPGSFFTKASIEAAIEENKALRALVANLGDLPNNDGDNQFSRKDFEAIAAAPAGKYRAELVAAAKFLLAHDALFRKLDTHESVTFHGTVSTDGRLSKHEILALVVNQQALVSDPELARLVLVTEFPNVAQGGKGLDMRFVSNDGLKALARAGLSASDSLREEVEFVAFLPESEDGTRNRLITAYYDVLGRANTRWMNASLNNPMDVTDPGHTGWQWMMIGANASNSVWGTISGAQKMPGGISLNWTERNAMADGNQIIFTDVAVRCAALLEAFPPGVPVSTVNLANFVKSEKYQNATKMFQEGDRQIRDAMFFMLAAREATDPEERRRLNFQASLSIAVHEQAAIQKQLVEMFGQTISEDGIRALGANALTVLLQTSPEELGNALMGRLKLGDTGPVFDLSKDLDRQGFKLPTGGPLAGETLADLSPSGTPIVTVGGKRVAVDGSTIGAANIAGWETPTKKHKGFEVKIEQLAIDGADDLKYVAVDGQSIAVGTSKATKPLENTGATKWTDYAQRMYYIGELFRLYTFDPKVGVLNDELSKNRVSTTLAFTPTGVKQRVKAG